MGRVIVINTSSLDSQTDLTVVSLPQGELKYTISTNSEIDEIHSLTKFENQLGNATRYSYNISSGGFNVFSKSTNGATNKYVNMSTITHPTGYQTYYTYESYIRNLGSSGLQSAFRISAREDKIGTEQKNKKTYTYSNNNMSGYPSYNDPLSLPSEYTYSTTVKDEITNIAITSTFDYKHQLIKEESKLVNKLVGLKEVQYDSYKLPTQTEKRIYNTNNDNFMKAITVQENDSYGNITAFWSPLADGNKNNTEYKTTYTYDEAYNLLLSKTYKQDVSTIVSEQNTLSELNKTIGMKEILVNGTLKEKTAFDYDTYGNVISIKRYKDDFVNFEQTQYTYSNGLYLTEIKNTGIKDSDGFLAIGTPLQLSGTIVTKCSEYDSMGRVKSVVDANGIETTFEYNYLGDITKQTNPDGRTVEYDRNYIQNYVIVKDENNNRTQYSYTPDGLDYGINLITDQPGENVIMTRKEYDGLNRLHVDYDMLTGAYKAYEYDHFSRITSKETRDSLNAIIVKEIYDYDDAYGSEKLNRIQKTIYGDESSPSIVTTEYTNNMGQTVKTGKVFGGIEYLDTYSYDYIGNKLTERSAYAASLNLPYSAKWEYDYAGRTIKNYNANGNYITMSYDLLGRMIASTDYAGTITQYTYDGLDRLLEKSVPISAGYSQIKRYDYDPVGNNIRNRVSNNSVGSSATWNRIDYDYDVRNRLQYVRVYNGIYIDNATKYTYDGVGNIISMRTDTSYYAGTDGKLTTYTYDSLGRIKLITDPLNQSESYVYKSTGYQTQFGQLERKIDRNGNIIDYAYDSMNRIISMKVTTPDGKIEQSNYTYTLTGAKKSESNTNVTVTYKYDELGRLIQENETGGIVKNYTYDIGNNRSTFNAKLNNTGIVNLQYSYDNMSRMECVYSNNVLQATYTYNINGAQEKIEYANGSSEHYNYNLANWLTRLESRNASNTVTTSFDYAYYADGNQKTKTDNSGRISSYIYDGAGRLQKESESTGLSIFYSYDGNSNRSSMSVRGPENYSVSYNYDDKNRLVKNIKTEGDTTTITNYIYDPNGNQTGILIEKLLPTSYDQTSIGYDTTGTELYEYDGLNRLTHAYIDGEETTYTYRTDGLRNSKTISEGTTTHIWDGQNIAVDLINGAVDTCYIRGINLIMSDNASSGQKYYFYNGHGDVVQLTDVAGGVIKDYDYDAFGNERQIAGQDDSLDTNPFRYSGEYLDLNSGTYYLRARYYDPTIARFTQEDTHWNTSSMIYGDVPLSLSKYTYAPDITAIRQSGNLYVYAMNNPLTFIDPSGETTFAIGGEATLVFLIKLGISGQLVIDDKGNFGIILAGEGGGGTPSASVSGTFTMTNADTIFDLSGVGFGTGGSAAFGLPVSLGIDVIGGNAKNRTPVVGGQIAVGVSTPWPEGHGQLSYSGVISLNWLPKWMKNGISNLIIGIYDSLSPEQQDAIWDVVER